MSELRDEIAREFARARAGNAVFMTGDHNPMPSEYRRANDILAAFAEAMTSDDVRADVERAVSDQRRRASRYPPSHLTPYQVGVFAVSAALKAAGVVKGEGE